VTQDDHRARHDPEVLGVQEQLVPQVRDVREVVADAVVAAIGRVTAGRGRRAGGVQLAVGGHVRQHAFDVPARERVVDRPHDLEVVRDAGRVPVVLRA
jgi:hypothetical protein